MAEQQPEAPAVTTPDVTQQVTSPSPKIQPQKNPKSVAAGKPVAAKTRKAREEQKKDQEELAMIKAKAESQKPRSSARCGTTGGTG